MTTNVRRIINKIAGHFSSMAHVRRLHGVKAVVGIYASKVPFSGWIIRKLFGGFWVKSRILGSSMHLDVFDGGLHRRLLLKGIREEEHVNQIRSNVGPGMCGVELGANIGYFGLLEARLVGSTGKIYCIEPAPENMRRLLQNIRENGLEDRMTAFQYLIGDHNGMEKLYLSEFANVHSLSSSGGKKNFVDVPMVTLDTFFVQNDLKPEDIDFLRMDIEGYEVMAFRGMKSILESSRPFKIFIEFHPMYYGEWGWTLEKFLRFLYQYGFRIREIAKHREYDAAGNLHPIILRDPTLDEVLASQVFNGNEGSQAFLERA